MARLRSALPLASAFAVSLLLGLSVSFALERAARDGRVARGVLGCGRELSGHSRQQAVAALSTCAEQLQRQDVVFALGTEQLRRPAGEVGAALDREAMAEEALQVGRAGGMLRQFGTWLAHLGVRREVAPRVKLDAAQLQKVIRPWVAAHVAEAVPASVVFSLPPVANYGRSGQTIEQARLAQLLLRHLQGWLRRSGSDVEKPSEALEVPLMTLPPAVSRQKVDALVADAARLLDAPLQLTHPSAPVGRQLQPRHLAKCLTSRPPKEGGLELAVDPTVLRAELTDWLSPLERRARDADFQGTTGGGVKVVPSENGWELDELELARRILQVGRGGSRHIVVPLRPVEPKLDTARAESLHVKGLVASFVTTHKCCQSRVHNIHVAARRVDGTVLLPGEAFSLNQVLGPRTPAAGYQPAPTIVHGEMEETSGGGVSQFATTLFNAVLDGGYEIIQRQPHTFYFPRYPEGHEATVSFPEPDLVFRNDTQAGLVIKTQFSDTFIKVLLFGDNGGRKVLRKKSARYSLVQPPIEYVADPALDPAKPKRLRAGQLGWTVLVSRVVTHPDGKQFKQQREVVYRPQPEVLRVHPCQIPEDAEGYTGEVCPEPEAAEAEFADEPREFEDAGYFEDPEGRAAFVFESED